LVTTAFRRSAFISSVAGFVAAARARVTRLMGLTGAMAPEDSMGLTSGRGWRVSPLRSLQNKKNQNKRP
jgi:hypothetical protein